MADRVAVIDGDAEALLALGELLEREGYDVLLLAEAAGAHQQLADFRPGVIVASVVPEPGRSPLERVRGHPGIDSTPVIVCPVDGGERAGGAEGHAAGSALAESEELLALLRRFFRRGTAPPP